MAERGQPFPTRPTQTSSVRTGRDILAQIFRRTVAIAVFSVAAVYALDYLLLRYKVAANREPFGTVRVQPYYAVPQKDHKTEFIVDDPEDETCVHSLFPHLGDVPCWYLSRNKNRRIDM